MTKTAKLLDHGQSYWLDDLSREMLDSGELEQRVKNDGLRGITSNPKTFADSIQGSDAYSSDISFLRKEGKTTEAIYESLMVDDVVRACDLLKDVYDESGGDDGFVSIEVDPRLARHTEATIQAARRLWSAVDRPNCMIKIPGTEEGIPAIETALAEGINVNITLLFSRGRYKQVIAAYQRAMDQRRKAGKSLDDLASVASFFLSRIDALVDELLEHRALPSAEKNLARQLEGRMAVASAKQVYREFQSFVEGPTWQSLQADGAALQRPLWASTSTKNPNYSKTLYVDTLIAKHTVNTMPAKTVQAFNESGTLEPQTILENVDTVDDDVSRISAIGIDLDYVSQRLEDEGIQKFIDPFKEGLKQVEDAD